jgi:hypothetical protein
MLQGKILDKFLLISSLRSKKILVVVVLPEESEMINSIGNTYQTKVKYTNVFFTKVNTCGRVVFGRSS